MGQFLTLVFSSKVKPPSHLFFGQADREDGPVLILLLRTDS